jgi:hypothetical protein
VKSIGLLWLLGYMFCSTMYCVNQEYH